MRNLRIMLNFQVLLFILIFSSCSTVPQFYNVPEKPQAKTFSNSTQDVIEVKEGTDLHRANLFGNVKTLISTNYNVVKKIDKWVSNDVTSKSIVTYNVQGNQTSYELPLQKMKLQYCYDDLKNVYEFLHYEDGLLNSRMTYTYDDYGRMIEDITYNPKGIIQYKTFFTYDENGNLVKEVTYNSRGSVHSRSIASVQ